MTGRADGGTGHARPWYRALAAHYLLQLPLRNLYVRARGAPQTAYWTWWEHREVRRLQAAVGPLPPAEVAVVVPTYRRPDFLRRAVASVLEQTSRDLVVVVVDDGGGQVGGLPEDPRLHVVTLGRNTAVLGVVNNVGIRLTSSRYVALLNDDNSWRPDHLERAVAALDEGADLVYTAMRRHLEDGTDVDVLSIPFDRRAMRRASLADSSTLVFRRVPAALFDRTPRRKGEFLKEDWEFVWRCSRRMRTRLVPWVTVDYLIHDGSYLTDWTAFWGRRRTQLSGGAR